MAVGAVTGREHGLVDSRCPVCGTLVAASAAGADRASTAPTGAGGSAAISGRGR